ncbi:MAG: hypothetical protein ACI94Y_003145 [Maribacter sp.]|jgi:hypothetical protein
MMTIIAFYAVSVAAYWLSKILGEELSPLLKALTLLGMAEGFILCLALAIQFGPMMLYGFFPVIVTFPLLSPFLFALLLFIEIRRQFHLFKQTALAKEEDVVYDSLVLNFAENQS